MKLWSWWVDATSTTESGTSLALFRIGLGLCVLWTLGPVVWSGAHEALWVGEDWGGIRDLPATWLVERLGGPRPGVIRGLIGVGMLGGLGLVVGLGGRGTALLTLAVVQALVRLNPEAGGSYDLLLTNGLWLAVLAPTTATLSLDARLRTGHWITDRPVGRWARYLIVAQLVLMYGSTGWQKLSAAWTPGGDFSALYYILQQPSWQRFDHAWAAWIFPLTQVATAITWSWEVLAPLLFLAVWAHDGDPHSGWRRLLVRGRVRDVFVVLGVVFHGSLLALMKVGPFSPLSLTFYAALYAPTSWERLARWWFTRQRVN